MSEKQVKDYLNCTPELPYYKDKVEAALNVSLTPTTAEDVVNKVPPIEATVTCTPALEVWEKDIAGQVMEIEGFLIHLSNVTQWGIGPHPFEVLASRILVDLAEMRTTPTHIIDKWLAISDKMFKNAEKVPRNNAKEIVCTTLSQFFKDTREFSNISEGRARDSHTLEIGLAAIRKLGGELPYAPTESVE